jgi:hypothetical protein
MVNDHRVYTILKEKLRLATGATLRDRLGDAFDLISHDRENNHKGDVDYAAAEHYLFSRWLVAYTSTPGWLAVAMAAGGYDLVKKLLGTGLIIRFGKGPVTPHTPGDVQWSRRGANDGLVDFKASLAGKTVPQDPDDPW